MNAGALPSGAVVLDTFVVSELMRAQPDLSVQAWVGEVAPSLVYTTAVSLAEVLYGLARLPAGRRRTLLGDAADEVFGSFADHILPFDVTAADHYADIVVEREHAGSPITGFDAQVATICRSNGAALATRNTDDFTGLRLELIDPFRADT